MAPIAILAILPIVTGQTILVYLFLGVFIENFYEVMRDKVVARILFSPLTLRSLLLF